MGIKPVRATITNTTAGTRTQCTSASNYATSIYFEAAKANTGNIYLGLSDVSSTVYISCLAAGEGFAVNIDGSVIRAGSATGGNEIQLTSFWIDSSVSGEKCQFTYMQRVGGS